MSGGREARFDPSWQADCALPPHPGPLPWGEGEAKPDSRISALSQARSARPTWLPLPKGEGWGEGEQGHQTIAARRNVSGTLQIESLIPSGIGQIINRY